MLPRKDAELLRTRDRRLRFGPLPFILLGPFLSPVNPTSSQRIRSAPALTCPRCEGPVNVGSRYVAVDGPAIHVYCSDACLHGAVEIGELDEIGRAHV